MPWHRGWDGYMGHSEAMVRNTTAGYARTCGQHRISSVHKRASLAKHCITHPTHVLAQKHMPSNSTCADVAGAAIEPDQGWASRGCGLDA